MTLLRSTCAAGTIAVLLSLSAVPATALVSTGPNFPDDPVEIYEGLGTWVDMYDKRPWANPERAVARMAANQVRTLYLETSNYRKKKDLYRPPRIERFIEAAHERDISVVAWYVPSFKNLRKDLRRSTAAIQFATANGERFDSFAMDIEATVVGDVERRNRRMLWLTDRVRETVGPYYALGAIVPDVQSRYWPGFPYRTVASRYDVMMPMVYFTRRTEGRSAVRRYVAANVAQIRDRVGSIEPLHVIGGIAGEGGIGETRAYARVLRDRNVPGGSYYDFPITTRNEWQVLRSVFDPPNEERDGTVARSAARPRIVEDHIPYGAKRKRQMARYSKRHYGAWSWKLTRRRVIVLHFTGGSSYESARNHFASNSPNRGELPGVCAHYIVDKSGTIYETVAPRVRCRHAIGLNHRSIGVEMVQEAGRSSHWADRQILKRRPQIRAALRLVAYLKERHDIRMRDVIGHAMANGSRFFRDDQGWSNDHTDWLKRDVKVFRRRLARIT